MTKSRKHRKTNTLHNVSNVAKKVVVKTVPVVEKGISTVYGTLASGFNLGVKGVNSFMKMSKKHKRRKSRKTHKR
jgi:hypothetical protein